MDSLPIDDHAVSTKLLSWLSQTVQFEASYVHQLAGQPPILQVHDELRAMGEKALSGESARPIMEDACPERIFELFLVEQCVSL